MLILLDNSGSMMGQRREIARHVINNLLDTLGNNDYVNVLQFTHNCSEVVPCFKNILVQVRRDELYSSYPGFSYNLKVQNYYNNNKKIFWQNDNR